MSRRLSIVCVGAINDHPRTWHWSLRVGSVTGHATDTVVYYHAVNGATWSGFEVRPRYSTEASASMNVRTVYAVGTLPAIAVDTALQIMANHPCLNTPIWNCQSWVRSCVQALYEARCITLADYNGFLVWDAAMSRV